MISKKMNQKLNEQITHEFNASQIYLAMACQFDGMGLKVLAGYFRKQTAEEREHALKILDYVLDVNGEVELLAIPAPQKSYASVQAAIDAALAHEKKVTQQIHDLVTLADEEKDYASRSFLKWFVDEQVEEVSTIGHLSQVASMAGNNLLLLEAYVARMQQK